MQLDRLFRSAETAATSQHRTPLSLSICAVTFVASVWAIGGGLNALGRGPRNETLERKWHQYERQAEDCDVLFLGTSRIYRNLDPAAFDKALYEQGLRVRSFNLGLPRMSILEARELAERLASRGPGRLKLVVLEPMLFIFDLDNWATHRDMATHDWGGTQLAVANTLGAESRRGSGWLDRLHYASPHVLSFACRIVNLGLAASVVFPPCPRMSETSSSVVRCEGAGFDPLPVKNDPESPWRERFQRFLALPNPPDWGGAALSDAELNYLKHLVACIREAGAEPVFLLGPRLKRDSHTAAVLASHAEHFDDVLLLDYLRGHTDDQLYCIERWHDFDHLNALGAQQFSRQVARDLAPALSKTTNRSGFAVQGTGKRSPRLISRETSTSLRPRRQSGRQQF
jgi:hypothetical protein